MNHEKEALEKAANESTELFCPMIRTMISREDAQKIGSALYLRGVAYAREKHGAYPGKSQNLNNVNTKEIGLFEKYHVERVDGKPMPAGCIVLEWKDPNAWPGIAAFSRAVRLAGYLQLSDDLDKNLEARGYCAREKQGGAPTVPSIKLEDFKLNLATWLYQEDHESNDKPRGWYLEVYTATADRLIEFINSLSFESKPKAFYETNLILAEKEIAKLKEQLKIAKGALERLEAGFAGMFGHQSVSPQQDFYDRGEQFVMDALKQLRDLEG